jgi:hypothetical protein
MAFAPSLSVVMPVHNALPWLDAAVESILGQSFRDFEFVILDDGSTDGSGDRLRDWASRDARIRLVRSEKRLGAAGSSNRVVEHARAPLIARMDADDIAHPERLARQMALMVAEPGVVLVGSLFDVIDADGRMARGADWSRLLRPSPFAPFCHPTILFRRHAFDKVGGYRAGAQRWEDVDLYLRLSRLGVVAVIPEPLATIRLSGASSRIRDGEAHFERSMDQMVHCLARWSRGQDYEDLIGEPAPLGGRISPAAFVATGSARLWAGRRAGVLGALLNRGSLQADFSSATVLAWAIWGAVSPGSLRMALRGALGARNAAARRRLRGRPWVAWKTRPGA